MTEWIEWDAFPDPPKRQREVRVAEILPPRQPEMRLHVHHHHESRGLQRWIKIAAVIFIVVVLFRSPMVLLLLAALAGWQVVSMFLFVIALLALVAWREHRSGRPF